MHAVKIDRSFISGVNSDLTDATIVRVTVELAHSVGLEAIAEGVENEDVLQTLRSLRCDVVQGYHLARPLDPAALDGWIDRFERSSTGQRLRNDPSTDPGEA